MQKLVRGHFSACGNEPGFNLAIVAVVEYFTELGHIRDWAAYEGATPFKGWSQEETEAWVAENGNKISEKRAKFYFSELPIRKYRS